MEAWRAAPHEVQRVGHNLVTQQQQQKFVVIVVQPQKKLIQQILTWILFLISYFAANLFCCLQIHFSHNIHKVGTW